MFDNHITVLATKGEVDGPVTALITAEGAVPSWDTTEDLGHVLHWSFEVKGPALLLTVVVGVDVDELLQVGVEHAVDDHTGLHGGDETDGCKDNGEVLAETHLNG